MEYRIEKDTMGEVQVPATNTGVTKPNGPAKTSKSVASICICHTKSSKHLLI